MDPNNTVQNTPVTPPGLDPNVGNIKDMKVEEIAPKYDQLGAQFNEMGQNLVKDVAGRQAQLIGNGFSAPGEGLMGDYNEHTYIEPAVSNAQSTIKQVGANVALNEGLDRAAEQAKERAKKAQERYNKWVEEQNRKARAAAEAARQQQARAAAAQQQAASRVNQLSQGFLESKGLTPDDLATMPATQRDELYKEYYEKNLGVDWNDRTKWYQTVDSVYDKLGATPEERQDERTGNQSEASKKFWARKDVEDLFYAERYSREGVGDGATLYNQRKQFVAEMKQAVNIWLNPQTPQQRAMSFEQVMKTVSIKLPQIQEIRETRIARTQLEERFKRLDSGGRLGADDREELAKYRAKTGDYTEAEYKRINELLSKAGISEVYTHRGRGGTSSSPISHTVTIRRLRESATSPAEVMEALFGLDSNELKAIRKFKDEQPDLFAKTMEHVGLVGQGYSITVSDGKDNVASRYWDESKKAYAIAPAGEMLIHSATGSEGDPELKKMQEMIKTPGFAEKLQDPESKEAKAFEDLANKYAKRQQQALFLGSYYNVTPGSSLYNAAMFDPQNIDHEKLVVGKQKVGDFLSYMRGLSRNDKDKGNQLVRDLLAVANSRNGHYIMKDGSTRPLKDKNGASTIGASGKDYQDISSEEAAALLTLVQKDIAAGNMDAGMFSAGTGTHFFDDVASQIGQGLDWTGNFLAMIPHFFADPKGTIEGNNQGMRRHWDDMWSVDPDDWGYGGHQRKKEYDALTSLAELQIGGGKWVGHGGDFWVGAKRFGAGVTGFVGETVLTGGAAGIGKALVRHSAQAIGEKMAARIAMNAAQAIEKNAIARGIMKAGDDTAQEFAEQASKNASISRSKAPGEALDEKMGINPSQAEKGSFGRSYAVISPEATHAAHRIAREKIDDVSRGLAGVALRGGDTNKYLRQALPELFSEASEQELKKVVNESVSKWVQGWAKVAKPTATERKIMEKIMQRRVGRVLKQVSNGAAAHAALRTAGISAKAAQKAGTPALEMALNLIAGKIGTDAISGKHLAKALIKEAGTRRMNKTEVLRFVVKHSGDQTLRRQAAVRRFMIEEAKGNLLGVLWDAKQGNLEHYTTPEGLAFELGTGLLASTALVGVGRAAKSFRRGQLAAKMEQLQKKAAQLSGVDDPQYLNVMQKMSATAAKIDKYADEAMDYAWNNKAVAGATEASEKANREILKHIEEINAVKVGVDKGMSASAEDVLTALSRKVPFSTRALHMISALRAGATVRYNNYSHSLKHLAQLDNETSARVALDILRATKKLPADAPQKDFTQTMIDAMTASLKKVGVNEASARREAIFYFNELDEAWKRLEKAAKEGKVDLSTHGGDRRKAYVALTGATAPAEDTPPAYWGIFEERKLDSDLGDPAKARKKDHEEMLEAWLSGERNSTVGVRNPDGLNLMRSLNAYMNRLEADMSLGVLQRNLLQNADVIVAGAENARKAFDVDLAALKRDRDAKAKDLAAARAKADEVQARIGKELSDIDKSGLDEIKALEDELADIDANIKGVEEDIEAVKAQAAEDGAWMEAQARKDAERETQNIIEAYNQRIERMAAKEDAKKADIDKLKNYKKKLEDAIAAAPESTVGGKTHVRERLYGLLDHIATRHQAGDGGRFMDSSTLKETRRALDSFFVEISTPKSKLKGMVEKAGYLPKSGRTVESDDKLLADLADLVIYNQMKSGGGLTAEDIASGLYKKVKRQAKKAKEVERRAKAQPETNIGKAMAMLSKDGQKQLAAMYKDGVPADEARKHLALARVLGPKQYELALPAIKKAGSIDALVERLEGSSGKIKLGKIGNEDILYSVDGFKAEFDAELRYVMQPKDGVMTRTGLGTPKDLAELQKAYGSAKERVKSLFAEAQLVFRNDENADKYDLYRYVAHRMRLGRHSKKYAVKDVLDDKAISTIISRAGADQSLMKKALADNAWPEGITSERRSNAMALWLAVDSYNDGVKVKDAGGDFLEDALGGEAIGSTDAGYKELFAELPLEEQQQAIDDLGALLSGYIDKEAEPNHHSKVWEARRNNMDDIVAMANLRRAEDNGELSKLEEPISKLLSKQKRHTIGYDEYGLPMEVLGPRISKNVYGGSHDTISNLDTMDNYLVKFGDELGEALDEIAKSPTAHTKQHEAVYERLEADIRDVSQRVERNEYVNVEEVAERIHELRLLATEAGPDVVAAIERAKTELERESGVNFDYTPNWEENLANNSEYLSMRTDALDEKHFAAEMRDRYSKDRGDNADWRSRRIINAANTLYKERLNERAAKAVRKTQDDIDLIEESIDPQNFARKFDDTIAAGERRIDEINARADETVEQVVAPYKVQEEDLAKQLRQLESERASKQSEIDEMVDAIAETTAHAKSGANKELVRAYKGLSDKTKALADAEKAVRDMGEFKGSYRSRETGILFIGTDKTPEGYDRASTLLDAVKAEKLEDKMTPKNIATTRRNKKNGAITESSIKQREASYKYIAEPVQQYLDGHGIKAREEDLLASQDWLRMASVEQTQFGRYQSMYVNMLKFAGFNKALQQAQLSGGIGAFNAYAFRQLLSVIATDPRALPQFLKTYWDARSSKSVADFYLTNREALTEAAITTGDSFYIDGFVEMVSKQDGTYRSLNRDLAEIWSRDQSYAAKRFKHTDEQRAELAKERGYSSKKNAPKYDSSKEHLEEANFIQHFKQASAKTLARIFDEPTFQRFIPVLQATMYMRNRELATRFYAKRGLDMSSPVTQARITKSAHMRTKLFWTPWASKVKGEGLAKSVRGTELDGIIIDRHEHKMAEEFLEKMSREDQGVDLKKIFSSMFFALEYKATMLGRIFNGARGLMVNPLDRGFVLGGARNDFLYGLLGVTFAAWIWNTMMGYETAYDDPEKLLMNFNNLGKFRLGDGNGTAAIDPMFSQFTLLNSVMRAGGGLAGIDGGSASGNLNWQRNSIPFLPDAVTDELTANLLSPYKSVAEIVMNNTYFGNNIWERPTLKDGQPNPNYNPARNVGASVMHLLGLDDSNAWVKGDNTIRDRTGSVGGSGLLQHPYLEAYKAYNKGEYGKALFGVLESPVKWDNLSGRAKTSLNTFVVKKISEQKEVYDQRVEEANGDAGKIDAAYRDFAKQSIEIIQSWDKTHKVLNNNPRMYAAAQRILTGFLSGEYDDNLNKVQSAFWKAKLDSGLGEDFGWDIKPGESVDDFNARKKKATDAYIQQLDEEFKARKVLKELGFKPINMEADDVISESRGVHRHVAKQLEAVLRGQLNGGIDFKELKASYEARIENIDKLQPVYDYKSHQKNKQLKAKLANEYNDKLFEAIAPFVAEYGPGILKWNPDRKDMSKRIADYVIVPADQWLNGKDPAKTYVEKKFEMLPGQPNRMKTDNAAREGLAMAAKRLQQGKAAESYAGLNRLLGDIRAGRVSVSAQDWSTIVKYHSLLKSRIGG